MDAILTYLFWGGLFFLMMRFGCGSHMKGRSEGAEPGQASSQTHDNGTNADNANLRWVAPQKDFDPVCGKSVTTQKAKSTVYDGKVYYFCSRDCREIFEAAPQSYIGAVATSQPERKHSHA